MSNKINSLYLELINLVKQSIKSKRKKSTHDDRLPELQGSCTSNKI